MSIAHLNLLVPGRARASSTPTLCSWGHWWCKAVRRGKQTAGWGGFKTGTDSLTHISPTSSTKNCCFLCSIAFDWSGVGLSWASSIDTVFGKIIFPWRIRPVIRPSGASIWDEFVIAVSPDVLGSVGVSPLTGTELITKLDTFSYKFLNFEWPLTHLPWTKWPPFRRRYVHMHSR